MVLRRQRVICCCVLRTKRCNKCCDRLAAIPRPQQKPPIGEGGDAGLPHHHGSWGDGAHTRSCRVVVPGTLVGSERLVLPLVAWIKFAFAAFFSFVWDPAWFTWLACGCGRRARSLLTEEDLETLLRDNAGSQTDRGNSARFDELKREIRLAWFRRNPMRHLMDPEMAMLKETAAVMQRFEDCLFDMDDRERDGYEYVPAPIDTTGIKVPAGLQALGELIAENCHEVWSRGRIGQGWRYGKHRDNDKKLHPDLIPYGSLSEETKQYDRDTSTQVPSHA